MANPGLLPSPRGEGPGGRCPAARGLVPVVGFAGAPVEGASVIQQLSCYGVLADSHLTSPRSTQSPGPPPLPCTTSLRRTADGCHQRFSVGGAPAGDERVVVTRPFPVEIIPADLVG